MQPNDDSLSEDNVGQQQPVSEPDSVGTPPLEPQAPVEPPLGPMNSEPQPMEPATEVPPAMDITSSPIPDAGTTEQPAPPVSSVSEQPVSFQPAADGEQPQPIQSVPVEPPKSEGFFGKIKSMFSKK